MTAPSGFHDAVRAVADAGRDPYLLYDARYDERLRPESRGLPFVAPDRWNVLELEGLLVVTLGPHGRRPVRGLADVPDAVPFAADAEAWAWVRDAALATSDVGFRALAPADLDPDVQALLAARDALPRTPLLGLPLLATGGGATWRAARVGDAFELHRLELAGATSGLVLRDPDLGVLERVLVAGLARGWWRFRHWRAPHLVFEHSRATDEQWAALRGATTAAVIGALADPDGGGLIPTTGPAIAPDLVTDAVHARAVARRAFPFTSHGTPDVVRLGIGDVGPHHAVIRHPEPPRYELVAMRERSNDGTTVLRTDDPAELEVALLRRL